MLNPFLRYPERHRRQAIDSGIVGEVARRAGLNKSVVSRAFSGETLQAKKNVVSGLNAWLVKNGLPKAGAVLSEFASLALIACVAYVWCWA